MCRIRGDQFGPTEVEKKPRQKPTRSPGGGYGDAAGNHFFVFFSPPSEAPQGQKTAALEIPLSRDTSLRPTTRLCLPPRQKLLDCFDVLTIGGVLCGGQFSSATGHGSDKASRADDDSREEFVFLKPELAKLVRPPVTIETADALDDCAGELRDRAGPRVASRRPPDLRPQR